MVGGVSKLAVLMGLLAAGMAGAEDTNEVHLEATYLAAPTSWCAADQGVPVVVKMDGPDVIEGPEKWPRQIRVRRGGEAVDVDAHGEDIDATAPVIGRFSADLRACQNPWFTYQTDGRWRLLARDGSEIDSGEIEGTSFFGLSPPFFRKVGLESEAMYARFDDRVLFTKSRPEVTYSQTFAAGPDKE